MYSQKYKRKIMQKCKGTAMQNRLISTPTICRTKSTKKRYDHLNIYKQGKQDIRIRDISVSSVKSHASISQILPDSPNFSGPSGHSLALKTLTNPFLTVSVSVDFPREFSLLKVLTACNACIMGPIEK